MGSKEVKKVPKVTQLVRFQTRSHLTLEPRLLTDTQFYVPKIVLAYLLRILTLVLPSLKF